MKHQRVNLRTQKTNKHTKNALPPPKNAINWNIQNRCAWYDVRPLAFKIRMLCVFDLLKVSTKLIDVFFFVCCCLFLVSKKYRATIVYKIALSGSVFDSLFEIEFRKNWEGFFSHQFFFFYLFKFLLLFVCRKR